MTRDSKIAAAIVSAALVSIVVVYVIGGLPRNEEPMPVSTHPVIAGSLIPAPVSREDAAGSFPLDGATVSGPLSEYAADVLGIEVSAAGSIVLAVEAGAPESYTLEATDTGVRIVGGDEHGVFNGIQSLRQLVVDGAIGATTIEDAPRFAYRGAMLDVVRHFFSVDEVKRYIDDIVMLKINHLHLHLTDDQGWRIEIESWPKLTEVGAATQVDGGGGGFYSQADYAEIVDYAAQRFVTIVPEIDMPGHTNAALHAYPELTCDGREVGAYEGVEVGFSSLCMGNERTYDFVEDVLRELAAITPGPYLHLGGDESHSTTDEDFLAFIGRVTGLGAATGKTVIGWHEMGRSPALPAGTIGQYWSLTTPQEGAAEHTVSFVQQGGSVIMSPADAAYIDMKYDNDQPLGNDWADGPTTLFESYDWDPASVVPGVGEQQLLGVEAPLWTETLTTIDELEFMAFPRLAAVAEIGWSPAGSKDWSAFAARVESLYDLLDREGVSYYRVPLVD